MGFVDMPGSPKLYQLIGSTPVHPSDHWATPAMERDLTNAAQDYIAIQDADPVITQDVQQLRAMHYKFQVSGFPTERQISCS